MNQMEAFYFPSSMALVDDSDTFLSNFSLKLSENFLVNTFLDPSQAIHYIRENYAHHILSDIHTIVKKEDAGEHDCYYTIDFDRIRALGSDRNRLNICSAVIVDYSMPLMDGMTFCEELADIPVPKIMLTGHADFKLAVNAFNQGLISQFIIKDSPDMYVNLLEAIKKCQRNFFQTISYPIIKAIQLAENKMIESESYFKCFNHILDQNNIVEYYLLDSQGTFLLVNHKGTKYYFQIVTNEHVNEYIHVAEDASADPNLLAGIKKRTMLPLFLSEADRQLSVSKWQALLKPVYQLEETHYVFTSSEGLVA